jgi:tRNA 2-thiouridine synthesizing protein B
MAMLHIVNKSPFERNSLQSCIDYAKDGAAVILTEDAVYGAMQGTSVADAVKGAMGKVSFYVLGPDVKARGMDEAKVIDGINVVGYDGFVDLVAEKDNVQSWL